jgi:hypothetical protein
MKVLRLSKIIQIMPFCEAIVMQTDTDVSEEHTASVFRVTA